MAKASELQTFEHKVANKGTAGLMAAAKKTFRQWMTTKYKKVGDEVHVTVPFDLAEFNTSKLDTNTEEVDCTYDVKGKHKIVFHY